MFVIAMAMVLASNGLICDTFCDPKDYVARLELCRAENEDLGKDIAYCKAQFHSSQSRHEKIEDYLANRGFECEKKLLACEARKKKVIKKKLPSPPVVVQKEEVKPCCQASAPVTVINNVNVSTAAAAAAVTEEVSLWKRERPSWLLGLRGAGGTAFCAPMGIGLVGLRANYLPIHLGLDVYTTFNHGTGAQLLAYPIQYRIAMWHLNAGFVWFTQRPFLLPNLPRQIDLTLGTGLELRVLPFLWVTADLVVRMPNPVAIAQTGQQFSDVFAKSLVNTQGMFGLMLRTW